MLSQLARGPRGSLRPPQIPSTRPTTALSSPPSDLHALLHASNRLTAPESLNPKPPWPLSTQGPDSRLAGGPKLLENRTISVTAYGGSGWLQLHSRPRAKPSLFGHFCSVLRRILFSSSFSCRKSPSLILVAICLSLVTLCCQKKKRSTLAGLLNPPCKEPHC